jgi:hypothetical protein
VTASGRRFACIINIRQSFIKLGKESLPWQLMHEYEFRIFFLGIRRAAERDFPKHGKVARAPARQSRSHACLTLFSCRRTGLLASLDSLRGIDMAVYALVGSLVLARSTNPPEDQSSSLLEDQSCRNLMNLLILTNWIFMSRSTVVTNCRSL